MLIKLILIYVWLLAGTWCYAQFAFTPQVRHQHFDTGRVLQFDKSFRTLEKLLRQTVLQQKDTLLGDEGYRITINADGITVTANTSHGLHYGMLTLTELSRQVGTDSGITRFPFGTITDYPRFRYRGMHLDVSRHFFPVETIKRYINELARNKMNYFHWHLTDDQGWRIEIRRYPLLTEKGAWRTENGKRYGGFYTQDQIREIVHYAAERNITVIPEIEMPGHSSAAVAAYPWLSCPGDSIAVPATWGIKKDIYCPTDETLLFLKNVLHEVCALFPSPYIHIGGDEVPKKQWKQSGEVKEIMKDHNLRNYEQVQHYFMKEMDEYLASKGRRSIVWGEVTRGGAAKNMVVMSWRGKRAGKKAARKGNDVIMAPRFSCYFDYPQSRSEKKPAWWMTYLPLKKVHRFNPQLKGKAALNDKILGGQATLWTEYVADEKRLWHQLTPRISAMAEALWGTNNNWESFMLRQGKQKPGL